jgi:nitrogen fixation NifU-like protein
MLDLRELYQEIIIDHNRHPRHFYEMESPTVEARGYNPMCGDKLTVYLKLSDGVVEDISFMGCGCAISQASASLMTEALMGKTTQYAHVLFEKFHQMLTSETPTDTPRPLVGELSGEKVSLDKLNVLAGVRTFPARVKCATLAWHTLEAALKKEKVVVTTE